MSKRLIEQSADAYRDARKYLARSKSVLDSAKFRRLSTIADNVVQVSPDVDSAYTSVGNFGSMYLYIHLRSLTGLKDPRLENVLNMLEGEQPTKVDTSDYPGDLNRDYRYIFEDVGEQGRIILTLSAYFSEDSETCKKVVVGYTQPIEPQPIYKLNCEELS